MFLSLRKLTVRDKIPVTSPVLIARAKCGPLKNNMFDDGGLSPFGNSPIFQRKQSKIELLIILFLFNISCMFGLARFGKITACHRDFVKSYALKLQ